MDELTKQTIVGMRAAMPAGKPVFASGFCGQCGIKLAIGVKYDVPAFCSLGCVISGPLLWPETSHDPFSGVPNPDPEPS